MSLNARQLAELDVLLSELVDGQLSEAGRAALCEMLQADPEALDHYVRFLGLCSDLHEQAATALCIAEDQPDGAARPTTASRGAPGRWRLGWTAATAVAGVALALVAGVLTIVQWVLPHGQPTRIEAAPVVGRLESIVGQVALLGPGTTTAPVANHQPVRAGQTIATAGPEAHATLRLADGTAVFFAGDTRVTLPDEARDCIHVDYGNLTAAVRRRDASRPMVFVTPEARVEVLGTRLSISRADRQTRIAVLQGQVRVERLSDQRAVRLADGQTAEVSRHADLRPVPVGAVPDHWSLDFGESLPIGWQTGQLVFEELPPGSKAAVRAVGVVDYAQNAQKRYQIRSHNAWTEGLFTIHADSWLHVRYRLQRPGTFLLYVVCRQKDFGQPVATVLTSGNLAQAKAGQWHTLTLPFGALRRARSPQPPPLDGQLVAFLLVFDSPEHDPGLTVERIWVTRGMPAEPRQPPEPQEPTSKEMQASGRTRRTSRAASSYVRCLLRGDTPCRAKL